MSNDSIPGVPETAEEWKAHAEWLQSRINVDRAALAGWAKAALAVLNGEEERIPAPMILAELAGVSVAIRVLHRERVAARDRLARSESAAVTAEREAGAARLRALEETIKESQRDAIKNKEFVERVRGAFEDLGYSVG